MRPVIYFRLGDHLELEEYDAAEHYFDVFSNRAKIPSGSLVIPRYSALPFYEELVTDMEDNDCQLLNSYAQHNYVADINNWYNDLRELTPKTYTTWYDVPEGAYVVKGVTNSRKHEWNRRMFASSKFDISRIVNSLLDDDLIKSQGLVVREYIPLKKLGDGINGLPITNEWRFFILGADIVGLGYYWSSEPECAEFAYLDLEAFKLISKVKNIVEDKINFYVVDIAQTESGDWIVIELNDGQMSGLSTIDPNKFYSSLSTNIKRKLENNGFSQA